MARYLHANQIDPLVLEANQRADAIGRAVTYTFERESKRAPLKVKSAVVMTIEDTHALAREHRIERKARKEQASQTGA
jgi:hypothetical protein